MIQRLHGEFEFGKGPILEPSWLTLILLFEDNQVMVFTFGFSKCVLPVSKIYLRSVLIFNLKLVEVMSS